jgi:hypothetical protein
VVVAGLPTLRLGYCRSLIRLELPILEQLRAWGATSDGERN